MTITFIIAMQQEAEPIAEVLGCQASHSPFADYLHFTYYQRDELHIVTQGMCPQHGVDKVGTQAASITTLAVMQTLKPRLIINAGTAGGMAKQGLAIGDLVLAKQVYYHSRRAPIEPFTPYLSGNFNNVYTPELTDASIKYGNISSGDSMYSEERDLEQMRQHHSICKDMEAAAIVETAALTHTPVLVLKSITDLIDTSETTAEQFMKNYHMATHNLAKHIPMLIDSIE